MRNDGEVIISTKLDTKSFEKQIEEVEYELKQIDYELSHAKELKLNQRTISEYTKKAEQLNNKLIDLRKRQNELNKSNFFSGMKSSIDSVIKKITKWGLAIFGIRSMYLAIRKAASTISQYNEQVKTDLSYIQYAMASTLEPIIKEIINLAYQLLGIINSISIALFNYNLFQNASIEKFKKMNAGANQLKKTLAGFDEMNVLQDTSEGGGTITPSIDLSKSQESGNKFLSFWTYVIKFWEEEWETVMDNIKGNWDTFLKGFFVSGKGFYDFVKGIIELIKGVIVGFIALFRGDLEGLKVAGTTIINGLKDIFIGALEAILGIFLNVIGIIKGIFLDLVQGIYNKVIVPIGNFFKSLADKIAGFFKKIGTTAGNVVASAFKAVINAVLKTIESILNTPIRAINGLIGVVNKIPGINLTKLSTFSLPRLARGGIVNNPGPGIMMGNYIAGEKGPEAVIPLDDETLDRLGLAFARHTVINATIPVYAYNRQVDKQIKRIQAEDSFATNR